MSPDARLRRWQRATLAALVLGYAGYYLCRSNFSVALPLLADELAGRGMDPSEARVRLGETASLGVLAYALGKFASGPLAERAGGRRAFLGGMALSALCTIGFAASGTLPLFSLAWIANRSVQSMGWTGLVKLCSRWFPATRYGAALGIASLSFLFGDAIARAAMGLLLEHGASWRTLFVGAAAGLLAIATACTLILREAPAERGAPEPPAPTDHLFAAQGRAPSDAAPRALELARTLLRSPSFQLLCVVSVGLTLLRETFNTWTPTYFSDVVGLGRGDAAQASALFPLLGGVSVLLVGWLSDRLGRNGRPALLVAGIALSVATLTALASLDPTARPSAAVALVALTGFVTIGPYSFLAGAMSLDVGGKRASASAAGILDGFGYLGGVLAGGGVARLALRFGWSGAFLVLAAVALVTCVAAGLHAAARNAKSEEAASR